MDEIFTILIQKVDNSASEANELGSIVAMPETGRHKCSEVFWCSFFWLSGHAEWGNEKIQLSCVLLGSTQIKQTVFVCEATTDSMPAVYPVYSYHWQIRQDCDLMGVNYFPSDPDSLFGQFKDGFPFKMGWWIWARPLWWAAIIGFSDLVCSSQIEELTTEVEAYPAQQSEWIRYINPGFVDVACARRE